MHRNASLQQSQRVGHVESNINHIQANHLPHLEDSSWLTPYIEDTRLEELPFHSTHDLQEQGMSEDVAFSRAFKAASDEINTVESHLDVFGNPIDQTTIEPAPHGVSGARVRIGADNIPKANENESEKSETDKRDELARTAGELLDKLKDNQSKKIQQSTFIGLMRQLRDREVVLQGNEFVKVRYIRAWECND